MMAFRPKNMGRYERHACTGKPRFETPERARSVAKRMRRGKRSYARRDDAYKCLSCGYWHIGTVGDD
jgi:hypothetical protein